MPENHRPTHILYIIDKENKRRKTRAGALWMEEGSGWLNLKLSPGVTLSARDQDRYYYSAYPNEGVIDRSFRESSPGNWDKSEEEDDIPF